MGQPEDPQTRQSARHETTMRGDQALLQAAEGAASDNKNMSLRDTLYIYRKSVLWSMLLSTALIMEGYDVVIINSFFGQSSFLHRFGKLDKATGKYFVPASWQGAINNGASIGQVIGLLINGYTQARFGAKRTYLCAMVAMAAAIFLLVFANSLEMLFAAELVCGIPWGIFQTLTTAYAADICPIALRGYLTSYVNCCWGFGLTIGAAVVRASLTLEGNWGWRMPYMIQWVWPIPLFFITLAAPESPYFLIRKGRREEAAKSLRKLARAEHCTDAYIQSQLALISHTLELEEAESEGGSWKELFKGTNRRRTEIVCVIWACQYWCGQPISNFATEFLQSAGMSQNGAFDLNIGNFIMIFAGTFISWIFFYRFGRRTLYIAGLLAMGLLFLIMGVIGSIPKSQGTAIGIGAIMIVITFAFGLTVAPVCYTIVAEIPASRVRSQSVVLARTCYILSQIVLQQLFPRFLTAKSAQGWDIGGKAGYIFVAINFALAFYCYMRLPETIGRTFGEIDIMFQNRIPARLFSTTVVDEFQADRVESFNNNEKLEVAHQEYRA